MEQEAQEVRQEGVAFASRFPFEVEWDRHRIILRGHLEGTPEVKKKLLSIAQYIPRFGKYSVEARDVRVGDGGVEAWSEVVSDFLGDSELTYAPSQFTQVLQREKGQRYFHHFSRYSEQNAIVAS